MILYKQHTFNELIFIVPKVSHAPNRRLLCLTGQEHNSVLMIPLTSDGIPPCSSRGLCGYQQNT